MYLAGALKYKLSRDCCEFTGQAKKEQTHGVLTSDAGLLTGCRCALTRSCLLVWLAHRAVESLCCSELMTSMHDDTDAGTLSTIEQSCLQ